MGPSTDEDADTPAPGVAVAPTSYDVVASRRPLTGIPPNTTGDRAMAWPVSAPPGHLFAAPPGMGRATRTAAPSVQFNAPMRNAAGVIINRWGQQNHQTAHIINTVFRFVPYIVPADYGMGEYPAGAGNGHVAFVHRNTVEDAEDEVIGLPELNHMLLKDALAGAGRAFKNAFHVMEEFRAVGFMVTGNIHGTDTKRGMTQGYSEDQIGSFIGGGGTYTVKRAGYNAQVRDIWGSAGSPGTELGLALVAGMFTSEYVHNAGISTPAPVAAFQWVPMIGRSVRRSMDVAGVKGEVYRICASQTLGFQIKRYLEDTAWTSLPLVCNPSLTVSECVSMNAQAGLVRALRDMKLA